MRYNKPNGTPCVCLRVSLALVWFQPKFKTIPLSNVDFNLLGFDIVDTGKWLERFGVTFPHLNSKDWERLQRYTVP